MVSGGYINIRTYFVQTALDFLGMFFVLLYYHYFICHPTIAGDSTNILLNFTMLVLLIHTLMLEAKIDDCRDVCAW